MGIEIRKGRFYWYDRKRVNGRMESTYFGAISADGADLLKMQAEVNHKKRMLARLQAELEGHWADDVLIAGEEFDCLADGVFREIMHSTGHTLHKRSEWRRTRGASAMVKTEAIVLAERDPEWGNVAVRALAGLLVMAAADDDVLSKAMTGKYRQHIADLLADDPEPTFSERMAATRAAHNWLAVNILECRASILPPASANATTIDRRVTLAEKRLHASLKSLAILRRLRKPAVVKQQVNIANIGPMVVSSV